MERRETSRASVAGHLVVLLGVAGWVVSCFLPLYRIADFHNARVNLYRQVSFGSFGIRLGAFLYLFGGIAAIGAISIVGLRGIQRWNGAVLAGAVLAWFLASIGTLITLFSAASQFNIPRASLAFGYWCLWASVVCVVVGTVMVLISARRGRTEEGGVAPQEQII